MISHKQLTANRENAKHSTGPKDTSKTRFNALKHGLRANQIIIRGETENEFNEFADEIRDNFCPRDGFEAELVDRIIFAFWRIRRCRKIDRAIVDGNTDLDYGIKWQQIFSEDYMEKLTRYETHALNSICINIRLLADMRNQSKEK
ncbi:MAG: hypothetical protein SCARUB_01671 [Candidatus Scalindua rubra]|uniref:Uncharacterized protein n=1 Tax=Candidatus Scalindua rubra TaxID=1872076 RepID=A0A1E3XC59_9BACT|nr:MAG: hypothetical protein SCARUB_01671 [Candidatus Scalindua rubra]